MLCVFVCICVCVVVGECAVLRERRVVAGDSQQILSTLGPHPTTRHEVPVYSSIVVPLYHFFVCVCVCVCGTVSMRTCCPRELCARECLQSSSTSEKRSLQSQSRHSTHSVNQQKPSFPNSRLERVREMDTEVVEETLTAHRDVWLTSILQQTLSQYLLLFLFLSSRELSQNQRKTPSEDFVSVCVIYYAVQSAEGVS